jgi:predicted nuclease with TOPRIM domain
MISNQSTIAELDDEEFRKLKQRMEDLRSAIRYVDERLSGDIIGEFLDAAPGDLDRRLSLLQTYIDEAFGIVRGRHG